MKKCTKCGKIKVLSEFYKDRRGKGGVRSQCKMCKSVCKKKYRQTHKSVIAKYKKRYNNIPEVKLAAKQAYIKRRYNLTPDEHQLMYILQNGKCAICKQPIAYDKIHTDHDHKTNKVRGLLCCRCNLWVAALDCEGFVESATKYINS